jgi:hypothetical protein
MSEKRKAGYVERVVKANIWSSIAEKFIDEEIFITRLRRLSEWSARRFGERKELEIIGLTHPNFFPGAT